VRIAPITKAAPKTAADAQLRALRPRASASTPFIAGGHVHVDRPKHRSNRPIAERLDDACQEAIREASKTLRGIQSFWIKNAECVVENDRITMYRVNGKISFLVEESK
jgi:flavin-binding protein dodecin